MLNLSEYINIAIERIIRNALKASLQNPKETSFIVKYISSHKKAVKIRTNFEKNEIHIPPFLIASISTNCNLFCKGCYARENKSCGEALPKNQLSPDRWKEIFKEASTLGMEFIILAGGEPLMEKNIIEKAATFKNIIFPVFTNGTLIEENYVKLFDKNRNLLPVLSLEGQAAETDERRGPGTYDTLTQVMKKLQQKGIFYGASITVTCENINMVTNNTFVEDLYNKGCKIIFYIEYVPVDKTSIKLAPGEKERKILSEKQDALRRQFPDMIFVSFPGDEKPTGGCIAAGRGFFHINGTGAAEPCPFSPYSDTNLREGTLMQALKSPLFKKIRENEMLLGEHTGGCVLFENEDKVKEYIE